MKVKIRKGDTVELISGKIEEKGKRGERLQGNMEGVYRAVIQADHAVDNRRQRAGDRHNGRRRAHR